MNIYSVLLILHIGAGCITLVTALIATLSKQLEAKHHIHVISGKIFAIAMSIIFLTAFPMSLIKFNLFLLLISVFSFYMMLAGWLYATDRKGNRANVLLIVSSIMLVVSTAMIGFGIWAILNGNSSAIPVFVFGVIGTLLARADWLVARKGGAKGKFRIAKHLASMLGATIAAVTAFLVNVVQLGGFLGIAMWLLPTLVLTPIIVMQSRKVQKTVQ